MIRVGLFLLVMLAGVVTYPVSAQRKKPKDPVALADTLIARERFSEAIPVLTKLVNDPDSEKSLNARYKRAICYYFTGQFDGAKADLQPVLAEAPDATRAWVLLVYIEQERSDTQGMLFALEQVVAQVPEPEFLRWRARLLMQEGRYEEAQIDLEKLQGSGDDGSSTELLLAMNEVGLHGLASAIPHFDRAIALEPDDASLYLYAGSYCLEEEQVERAQAYFTAGLVRQPDDLDLILYCGYALVEMKKVEEGCRLLRKAFYAGHEDAGAYLNEHCFHNSR